MFQIDLKAFKALFKRPIHPIDFLIIPKVFLARGRLRFKVEGDPPSKFSALHNGFCGAVPDWSGVRPELKVSSKGKYQKVFFS